MKSEVQGRGSRGPWAGEQPAPATSNGTTNEIFYHRLTGQKCGLCRLPCFFSIF